MATDRHYPKLYNKQTLPLDLLEKHVLSLLLSESEMTAKNFYRYDGSFDNAWTMEAVDVNDVSIIPGAPYMAVDGVGGVIALKDEGGDFAGRTYALFPNEDGVEYDVGYQTARYPAAPTTVPVTPFLESSPIGKAEYRLYRETVGRMGNPDSVTVNGNGTLTFVIDGLLIDGGTVSYAFRKARVWLRAPASFDESIAVQRFDIAFSSGSNKISTTNGSAEDFGQSAVGSPSTNPEDYFVLIEGPTLCKRSNRDLRTTLALTGTVATNGRTVTGTGTSFTTQLKAGDSVWDGKQRRTVVRVTGNTAAKIDEPFEANLSGATLTRCGVFFVGKITGAGVDVTPTYDITDQNVITFTGSDDDLRRRAAVVQQRAGAAPSHS